MQQIRVAFFGTAPLAGAVLDELAKAGFVPSLIVASKDKELRNGTIEFPPEKRFALERDIDVIQPGAIDDTLLSRLKDGDYGFFVVASYGKILPKALIDIPPHGIINMHPSLLPKLRGPSPIRSAILNDEQHTGVSIMLMDEKMDHGPILSQKEVALPEWPMHGSALDELLAREGGKLLAETLPGWLDASIEAREQDHTQATVCKMFKKEDGLLDLDDDAYKNLLKIRAFEGWPGTFAFFERPSTSSGQATVKKIRVQILDAHVEKNHLIIDRVKPEGKKEMPYGEFLRSDATPAR